MEIILAGWLHIASVCVSDRRVMCLFAGLVMLRTLAVYSCFATATGIVARTDAVHTAAHQVCLQVGGSVHGKGSIVHGKASIVKHCGAPRWLEFKGLHEMVLPIV